MALVKLVTVHPALGTRPGGALRSVALAIDATNGETIGLIDGHALTTRRTAATSVLAARALARPDASRLTIVGAGAVAAALAEAYAASFPLTGIAVWARRAEAAEALAAQLRDKGLPARADADLDAAISDAEIIATATLSTEPLLTPAMVRDGAHLDLIGGYTAAMREAEPRLTASAAIVVDSSAALDAGDLAAPIADGLIDPAGIITLSQLLRGDRVPSPDRRITLFKSVGLAIEDLAAAEMVVAGWRRAGAA
ncbi:hypothetical protein [Sphingomonas bacterium]|uniref:hypothetical protein n=1 Tax=Sphingomonas bacterium TaxID=1895847 RepID=UPI0020C6E116|nr:hypothetical protein [Sphingomonas bacterium]